MTTPPAKETTPAPADRRRLTVTIDGPAMRVRIRYARAHEVPAALKRYEAKGMPVSARSAQLVALGIACIEAAADLPLADQPVEIAIDGP